MPDNIYVAGFPYKTTKDELTRVFSACGTVLNAKIIMDRETGRPTGFGFVEMSTPEEVKAAVAKLNGTELGGRKLFVVEARPQKERSLRPDPPRPRTDDRQRPGQPGFVERRSGKDRRQGADSGRRAASPAPAAGERSFKPFGKKPFEKKPFDPAKKPFGKKPWKPKAKPQDAAPKPHVKTVPPLRGEKWYPKKKD